MHIIIQLFTLLSPSSSFCVIFFYIWLSLSPQVAFREGSLLSLGVNFRVSLTMAGSSSASYIHMVQHMIEKCLIFHMSKEECVEALSKHANITPVITSTVWTELEKENKEFFKAYEERQSKQEQMSEEETNQMIQKIISDSSKESDD